jgi:hypothetical protein
MRNISRSLADGHVLDLLEMLEIWIMEEWRQVFGCCAIQNRIPLKASDDIKHLKSEIESPFSKQKEIYKNEAYRYNTGSTPPDSQ